MSSKFIGINCVSWKEDGLLHRADGPAYMSTVTPHKEWWWYGEKLTQDDWKKRIRNPEMYPRQGYGLEYYCYITEQSISELESMKKTEYVEEGGKRYVVKTSPTSTFWYLDGKLHRENGPAIISEFGSFWYWENKNHRKDGPAVKWKHGGEEYWLYGRKYEEAAFKNLYPIEESKSNSNSNKNSVLSDLLKKKIKSS